ncbi:uncharacterized protein LOC131236426 isoform X2 [Magnolia sinica]|uniref:uncharacterized protein LOC131236426 isoform X2 n=1 Tax=Magnolia sinica TaxID=86752 RepID=UPI002659C19C|nr:uncharacterized protein LOC131236426 isoform X2 [Magnolia sinica]
MVADPTKLDECQLPRVECVTDAIMCMCVYIGSLPMQSQPIQSVMSSWIASHQRLIIDKKKRIGGHSSPPSIKRLTRSHKTPFPFLPNSIILRTILDPPKSSSNPTTPTPFSFLYPFPFPFQVVLPSLIFSAALLSLRLLPQDLPLRWHRLLVFSEEAESAAAKIPSHVWQAVVACEDRRFFSHCGIDLIGIWRAILLFPAGGGGSTITQQLVKNVFLKHERKFSRKIIEVVLALILEMKMSKWKILCSYLSKIYWGHGMYGIESASAFYFGKHPSFLSLAESAMLAGIIPSPERRSPLREPSRKLGSPRKRQAKPQLSKKFGIGRRQVLCGKLEKIWKNGH